MKKNKKNKKTEKDKYKNKNSMDYATIAGEKDI